METVTNINQGFIDTMACHYLNGAADCFLEGVAHYNDFRIGKIERSFSEIQRAWNSLWMADVKAENNGNLRPTGSQSFGIENFMDKDFGKPNPKKKTMLDYDLSKAAKYFKELKVSGGTAQANYSLVYQLRNLNQHDILEYADGSCSEITDILNPYMTANFFNFLETYNEVAEKVIKKCKEPHHIKFRASGVCAYKKIVRHHDLISYVSVPTGLNRIKYGAMDKYAKRLYVEPSKAMRDKRRDLQNTLNILIKENQGKINIPKSLSKEEKIEMNRRWSYALGDTPVYNRPDNPKKFQDAIKTDIPKIIDSFRYSSLSEIAQEMLELNTKKRTLWTDYEKAEHERLRQEIQKVQESLIEEGYNGAEDCEFWRTFWSKKPRYSTEFAAEVRRRLINLISDFDSDSE